MPRIDEHPAGDIQRGAIGQNLIVVVVFVLPCFQTLVLAVDYRNSPATAPEDNIRAHRHLIVCAKGYMGLGFDRQVGRDLVIQQAGYEPLEEVIHVEEEGAEIEDPGILGDARSLQKEAAQP